jgi:predicted glycosyltransferase
VTGGPRVGLLVQNGLGLGHVRRALLVARALHELRPDTTVFLLSQARSRALYAGERVRVLNLPRLSRLPNHQVEHAVQRAVAETLARLDLDLLVEESVPDGHYRRTAAYAETPSVFLLLPVSALGFDQLRRDGAFERSRRLVLTDLSPLVERQPHTPASRLALRWSKRIAFTPPVYVPAPDTVAARGGDGIVFSLGGGGDHSDETFGDRLVAVAECVAGASAAPVTVALGPYYAGRIPDGGPGIEIAPFFSDLPGRLRTARVAVIRPGTAVLHEALSGGAFTILVPAPYPFEGQRERAELLAETYAGVAVADVDDVEGLEHLVRAELAKPAVRYERALYPPGQQDVARILLEEVERGPAEALRRAAFVALLGPRRVDALPVVSRVGRGDGASSTAVLSWDDLFSSTPADLVQHGIELVLGATTTGRFAEWCAQFAPEAAGILTAALEPLRVRSDVPLPARLLARVEQAVRSGRMPAILLDADGVADDVAAAAAREARAALAGCGFSLLDVDEFASAVAEPLLTGRS